jgi:7-cyano-7-deazaguanine synthase
LIKRVVNVFTLFLGVFSDAITLFRLCLSVNSFVPKLNLLKKKSRAKTHQLKSSCIVLLSGGLDSAVALYWALKKNYIVHTLSFDYFRRTRKEIESAVRLSKFVNCPNQTIRLDFLREIEDSKKSMRNEGLGKAQSAYIPCRNLIFYGIAASFSEISDAKYIIGGHNKNDVSSFPDSSPEFFRLFNETASFGRITGDRTGKVLLPLSHLDKSQVVKLGTKLGVPFGLTWTCYKSNEQPCGKCYSCLLRKEAFQKAGFSDPLVSTVRS